MNTLSWLVYAAEISGNISAVLFVAAIMFIIVGGFAAAISGDRILFSEETRDSVRGCYRRWFPVAAVAIVLAAFLPSKTTIYLIAASEIGETVVTSPDAIEMMTGLKAVIKKRLKDELTD